MNDQQNATTMPRGLVVGGAILIQLCLGAIYAWSVFTPPLTASQAGEIAAIYDADQLGLTDETFAAMNSDLSEPRRELVRVGFAPTERRPIPTPTRRTKT